MAKDKERLRCLAFEYLDPVPCPVPPLSLVGALFDEDSIGAPIRALLEQRSDRTFVDRVVDQLISSGLGTDDAQAAAFVLLTQPTLSMREPAGNDSRIVQAVLLEMQTAGEILALELKATISCAKPPEVKEVTVDVALVDPEADLAHLMNKLVSWRMAYSLPLGDRFAETQKSVWGWVGDGNRSGYVDVPRAWQSQVSAISSVLRTHVLFASTWAEARTKSMHMRADLILGLVGCVSKQEIAGDTADRKVIIQLVGVPGMSFDGASSEAFGVLVEWLSNNDEDTVLARELKAGEIVYHRKRGRNAHFDLFDEGSVKPCLHGASSFVSWGGDKASKGMARRYTNFEPGMLRHCKRFPNCNVYAVDASRI